MPKRIARQCTHRVPTRAELAAARKRILTGTSVAKGHGPEWSDADGELYVDELNAFCEMFPELRSQLEQQLKAAGWTNGGGARNAKR